MASISCQHIYKIYPGATAPSVTDFNLEIQDKEFITNPTYTSPCIRLSICNIILLDTSLDFCHCFRNFQLGNMANAGNLPLFPFRTDNW